MCLYRLQNIHYFNQALCVNSLWPSDAIWHHRTWSTLVEATACYLTVPSRYLNQCWLIISELLCHPFECASWQEMLKISLLGMSLNISNFVMTSSNGNIFRVTGPLWGESTGHQWIPLIKVSDAELSSFLWSEPQQTVEQTMETRWFDTPWRSLWRHCNIVLQPQFQGPVS